MDNNIVDSQVEALNNSLNYYKLNGYTIHKYYQEDKRRTKQLYFLTDSKGTSLTGHWDFSELNSFIRGYGKAVNSHDELLEALKNCVIVMERARNLLSGKDGGNWGMLDTGQAKAAIQKAETNSNLHPIFKNITDSIFPPEKTDL